MEKAINIFWLTKKLKTKKRSPTTTYAAGCRKGKKEPLKEVIFSHPALSSEKSYLEAWFSLLSFCSTREKAQIFSSEAVSECIKYPEPTICTR